MELFPVQPLQCLFQELLRVPLRYVWDIELVITAQIGATSKASRKQVLQQSLSQKGGCTERDRKGRCREEVDGP